MKNVLREWIGIRSHSIKKGARKLHTKIKPNTQTRYHKHTNYQEFYILYGQLIDKDNTKFNKGDFLSFKPSFCH